MMASETKEPLTLKVLLAAGECIRRNRITAPNTFLWTESYYRMLKHHICQTFDVTLSQLEMAISDIYCGLAHPSEAFVNAREVATRLKGEKLTMRELANLVKTIEEREAMGITEADVNAWSGWSG
jgi:hypothetical protein